MTKENSTQNREVDKVHANLEVVITMNSMISELSTSIRDYTNSVNQYNENSLQYYSGKKFQELFQRNLGDATNLAEHQELIRDYPALSQTIIENFVSKFNSSKQEELTKKQKELDEIEKELEMAVENLSSPTEIGRIRGNILLRTQELDNLSKQFTTELQQLIDLRNSYFPKDLVFKLNLIREELKKIKTNYFNNFDPSIAFNNPQSTIENLTLPIITNMEQFFKELNAIKQKLKELVDKIPDEIKNKDITRLLDDSVKKILSDTIGKEALSEILGETEQDHPLQHIIDQIDWLDKQVNETQSFQKVEEAKSSENENLPIEELATTGANKALQEQKRFYKKIADLATDGAEQVKKATVNGTNAVIEAANRALGGINDFTSRAGNAFMITTNAALDKIVAATRNIGDNNLTEAMKETATRCANQIRNVANESSNAIRSVAVSGVNRVRNSESVNAATNAAYAAFNNVKELATLGSNKAKNTITSVFNSIKNKVTRRRAYLVTPEEQRKQEQKEAIQQTLKEKQEPYLVKTTSNYGNASLSNPTSSTPPKPNEKRPTLEFFEEAFQTISPAKDDNTNTVKRSKKTDRELKKDDSKPTTGIQRKKRVPVNMVNLTNPPEIINVKPATKPTDVTESNEATMPMRRRLQKPGGG